MGNSKDFAIAEPSKIIKIAQWLNQILSLISKFDKYSVLLPRNGMNGVTSSDNISVLVYNMACLDGHGLYASIDSEAADSRFNYLSILL